MNKTVFKIYCKNYGYFSNHPSHNFKNKFKKDVHEGTEFKSRDAARLQLMQLISQSIRTTKISYSEFKPEIVEIQLVASIIKTLDADVKPLIIDSEILKAVALASRSSSCYWTANKALEGLQKKGKLSEIKYMIQIQKSKDDRYRASKLTTKIVRDQLRDLGINSKMYNYSQDIIFFKNKEHALLAKLSFDIGFEMDIEEIRNREKEKLSNI